jgi:hypothetical protein
VVARSGPDGGRVAKDPAPQLGDDLLDVNPPLEDLILQIKPANLRRPED